MWVENKIHKDDLDYIISVPFIDWSRFKGKHVLVTGGTGLIGASLVDSLVYADIHKNLGLKVSIIVRNVEKAADVFEAQLAHGDLDIIQGDVSQLSDLSGHFDFIVHAASPTSSRFFAEHPVETIDIAISGTKNMLETARRCSSEAFVYLSSMEVYGAPQTDEKIKEDHVCNIDLSSPRSSYPESKRLSEVLCTAYVHEYGVHARSIRLTQTFGPGVAYDDQRVFAQFARCALEGKDIQLATKGETKRSYLYTADAVTAIIAVLLNGNDGEAYNAANEDTYCSILDMAKLVSSLSRYSIRELVPETSFNDSGIYAPVLHMNLDTTRLRALGWYPRYSLKEMFRRMIISMEGK